MLLTCNDTIAKLLSEVWPIGQIMALRGTVILAAIVLILTRQGKLGALRIQNRRAMAARSVSIMLATFAFLTALSLMPIADAIAIVFISPVLATALAIVFLGERVGWRRWGAMGAGLVGVVIAVNPGGVLGVVLGDALGGGAFSYPWEIALLPLSAALLTAIRDVSSRRLVSGDDSLAIMFYTVLLVAAAGYASVLWSDWVVPSVRDIVLILITSCFMFGAYFFQIESFRFAPVNLVAPFRYVSLIFAAVIGWIIWADIPSWNMTLGAVVIVASGLFIWWRERRPQP